VRNLHFTTHGFDLDFVLQQLLLNLARVGVRLVALVHGNNHRNTRRFGVGNRFLGLRHDAVIGRDDENHHIGDVCTACPHLGKGRVTRRIEEGDDLAAGRGNLVRADVLGDATRFTGNHVGFAVVVEDRCLTVVNVTHDRHNRWTRCFLPVVIDWAGEAFENIRCRNAADVVAKLFDHQFSGIGVDGLVHRRHDAHFHQHPDNIARALGHTVGELTHGDGFRHDNVADDLLLCCQRFFGALLLPLALTANGRQGAHAIFITLQRVNNGQLGAAAATRVVFRAQCGLLALLFLALCLLHATKDRSLFWSTLRPWWGFTLFGPCAISGGGWRGGSWCCTRSRRVLALGRFGLGLRGGRSRRSSWRLPRCLCCAFSLLAGFLSFGELALLFLTGTF